MKDDFLRHHDVFCSVCSNWAPLRNTKTIEEAIAAARKVGFYKVKGRMVCKECKDATNR